MQTLVHSFSFNYLDIGNKSISFLAYFPYLKKKYAYAISMLSVSVNPPPHHQLLNG
jgi:hypothetical protein